MMFFLHDIGIVFNLEDDINATATREAKNVLCTFSGMEILLQEIFDPGDF